MGGLRDSLYIALSYLRFYKLRSVVLITCVTLIIALPLALQLLLAESQRLLLARADNTPLLIGEKGSALDLTMNSLYFAGETVGTLPATAVDTLAATELAQPVPLHVTFNAQGFPIVGTTEAYFDFRGLDSGFGSLSLALGDCVVGAKVAEELGLQPGDSLVSSPDSLFDVAGVYPLKMNVAGVLEEAFSPDDRAIFVSLETAWVIAGLVHGHEDLAMADEATKVNHDKGALGSKLVLYSEVTDANRDSFHAHGGNSELPVTAIIAIPGDDKSSTILRGRYLNAERGQIVQPPAVIGGLMQDIFRVKALLDSVLALVGFATVLALALVLGLSVRLREAELQTNHRLGCSRMTTWRLIGAELLLVVVAAGIAALGILAVLSGFAEAVVSRLLMF